MDETQLKTIIDTVFGFVETKESGHPVVVAVLKGINTLIDSTALPLILAQLQAKGIR